VKVRFLSAETKFCCQVTCTVDTIFLQLEESDSFYSETFKFTSVCTIGPLYCFRKHFFKDPVVIWAIWKTQLALL